MALSKSFSLAPLATVDKTQVWMGASAESIRMSAEDDSTSPKLKKPARDSDDFRQVLGWVSVILVGVEWLMVWQFGWLGMANDGLLVVVDGWLKMGSKVVAVALETNLSSIET